MTAAEQPAARMSPADELRAAAAKLRETAERATDGPWYVVGPPWNDRTLYVVAGHPDPHFGTFVADPEDPTMSRRGTENADATWIAFMNPGLAEPLAALIDKHRTDCAIMRVQPREDWLMLARAINGGAQ